MKAMNHDVDRVNLKLLKTAIRFNARILGLTAGTLAAVVIYIATQASIVKWGGDSGGYLGVTSDFLSGIFCVQCWSVDWRILGFCIFWHRQLVEL